MTLLSLLLPVAGQQFSTEAAKVANDLTAIQTWANGLVDATNMTGASMTAYTPTWTGSSVNPAIGNGTLAGHYFAVGKCVLIRIGLVIGSTTTLGTGTWALSLPVGTKSDGVPQTLTGMANPASSMRAVVCQMNAAGSSINFLFYGNGAGSTMSNADGWVAGNVLALQGVYESA